MDQMLYLAVIPIGAILVGALGLYLNRRDSGQQPQNDAEASEELRELSDRVALLESSLVVYKSKHAAVRYMAARDSSGRLVSKSRRPEARAALARIVAAE